MAKTTIVQITDDLDGSPDAQEVSFSFQGTDYTIDLAKRNLAALEKALQPYIDVASKGAGGSGRTARKPSKRSAAKSTRVRPAARATTAGRTATALGQDTQAIRAWAQAQGIEVSTRGRISQAVFEQYEKAHNS